MFLIGGTLLWTALGPLPVAVLAAPAPLAQTAAPPPPNKRHPQDWNYI